MVGLCEEILEEWGNGCFYTLDLLVQAYYTFLDALVDGDVPQQSQSLQAQDFLREGFNACLATNASTDEYFDMHSWALDQVGGGVVTRSHSRRAMSDVPVDDVSVEHGVVAAVPDDDAGVGVQQAISVADGGSEKQPFPAKIADHDDEVQHGVAMATNVDQQPSSSGLKRRLVEYDDNEEEEIGGEDEPTIEILQTRQRVLHQFKGLTFREEVVMIQGLEGIAGKEEAIRALFEKMLRRQQEAVDAKPDDRCTMEIKSSENSHKAIWFPLRRADQVSADVVLDQLALTVQSNENFLINGKLFFHYTHVPTPKPAGAKGTSAYRKPLQSFQSWLADKIKVSTIYSPENTQDQLCLARSIVVSQFKLSKEFAVAQKQHVNPQEKKKEDGKFRKALWHFKKPSNKDQSKQALQLCKLAGIAPTQPADLDSLAKVQDALPDFRLCVYGPEKTGKHILFKGPLSTLRRPRKNIYLLWHDRHFYAILSPAQAFGHSYYCPNCLHGYSNRNDHYRCEGSCKRCSAPEEHNDALTRCDSCQRYFAGSRCFNYHQTAKLYEENKTACETVKFCSKCETTYKLGGRGKRKIEKHFCGMYFCKYCSSYVKEGHQCYMCAWMPEEPEENTRYIKVFFDLETVQNTVVEGKPESWREHKANLVVCQQVCILCHNIEENENKCAKCGTRQLIFHSMDDPEVNPVGQFIDYVQSLYGDEKTHVTCFSHNGQSFDGFFIIEELLQRGMKPEVTLNGAKIITMSVGRNLVFKDSLLFMPQKLSQLPKSVGFSELKKGYFPFLFNEPKNYDYVGPIPAKEYYCPGIMKRKDLATFEKWHDEQVSKNYVFDFRKEIIDYCISDVNILRRACEKFSTLFNEIAGFDPLHHAVTLSSACMNMFRKNHLPVGKIGIVPNGAYRGRDLQSFVALKWLDYEQHKLRGLGKIQTAETGREKVVLGRKVDGYAEIPQPDGSIQKKIYQLHGCYHHCHMSPDCHLNINRRMQNTPHSDAEMRYMRTLQITEMFRNAGYEVEEIWECEFYQELKINNDMKQYFEGNPFKRIPPLRLRDALYGGRTSAIRSYLKADVAKGEKIKIMDVVSEYPNANLRGAYPYGHPDIYLEGDVNMPAIEDMNGVIKATVLPPRDLFLPLLPYKCNKKLLFPLCRTCAETQQQTLCQHEDPKERMFTGTRCAPEFQLAVLKKGYTVVMIHEVYQYPGTLQFNPETGADGLFSGYVRANMALKQHASGWPAGCDTQGAKEEYIRSVREKDGIELDPSKMERNEGLRYIAKLILNAFWGKLAQRTMLDTSLHKKL